MKPLTDQEMADIIATVRAKLKAKTPAEKFADAVEKALNEHLDQGIDIDDPRINDFLKSFIADPAAIIKGGK